MIDDDWNARDKTAQKPDISTAIPLPSSVAQNKQRSGVTGVH